MGADRIKKSSHKIIVIEFNHVRISKGFEFFFYMLTHFSFQIMQMQERKN